MWTSLAFVFTVLVPILVLGQNPCPKTGSGFYPDPNQCDKYWECRKGKATSKLCADGLVFNPNSPLYERCQYPFYIDCTGRENLQPAKSRRNCPRANGLYPHDKDCSAFYQCNGGLARVIRCQGQLAFNPTTGTCQWPHLVPGCENPEDGAPGPAVVENDEDHITVTTTARPVTNRQSSRDRTQSRSRRPSPAPEAQPTDEPTQPPRNSRAGSRNRQSQPRATVPPPPPPQEAPVAVPLPFQPPQNVRRFPSYTAPQRGNDAPANDNSEAPPAPPSLPLPVPVPFQPPAGVRRIPNFGPPPPPVDLSNAAEPAQPAQPAPTRSQNPNLRRGPPRTTEAPSDEEPEAAAPTAPPARRVVFRRPVTTTQAAPANDDYNYDDFSK